MTRFRSFTRQTARATRWLLAASLLGAAAVGAATAQNRAGTPLTLKTLEAGLPDTYSAPPIRAMVVESKTGFGLDAVYVLARWELSHVVGGTLPSLAIQEAVTGPAGEFVIPGFPPRPRPGGAALLDNSPALIIFKPGFLPLTLRNEPKETFVKRFPNYKSMSARDISSMMLRDGAPKRAVQTSFWNEMTIDLETFTGSDSEWLAELAFVAGGIRDNEAPFARNMLAALRAERSRFDIRKLSDRDRRSLDLLFWRIDRLLEARSPR